MPLETPSPPPIDPRVAASIDAWKRKLLDLTMRNRLLNFRENKVSTVTVCDEQPTEVFRRISIRGEAMRFRPAPSRGGDARPGVGLLPPSDPNEFESENETGIPETTPYEREDLPDHHTDSWLQTTSPAEKLQHSLLRIDTQARTTIEEQGVNTLFLTLGLLRWTESEDSHEIRRAPIVLLPVRLKRRSARSAFQVEAADDEPLLNPALVEMLRRQFGVELPDLPAADALDESYDLQSLLGAVLRAVGSRPGWGVTREIFLGLYSFQKFVMYKDLEKHSAALAAHEVVQRIATRTETGSVIGLPHDVRDLDLDEDFPPEATAQVVDADASQLRAIAAVDRGHHLVMEGPPGTGKSQTITNLIAQALWRGQKVLFVAEKMAALDVVASRLGRIGLGELCLELHSSKTSKRAVLDQIRRGLNASLEAPTERESARGRLPPSRRELTEYVRAVHGPFGAIGETPFRAYGELERVLAAPRIQLALGAATVDRPSYDRALRALDSLAATAKAVGAPTAHPFRGSRRTFFAPDEPEEIGEAAARVVETADEVMRSANEVALALGLPPINNAETLALAREIAELLHRSPGAPLDVLRAEAWNAPPPEAQRLIDRGRRLRSLSAEIRCVLLEAVVDHDPAPDIALVASKLASPWRLFAIFDARYRAVRRRWKGYRLPTYRRSMAEQLELMRQVETLRAERATLAAADALAHSLFGLLWHGEASSWDTLERYVAWVVEFRGACVRYGLADRALEVAARGAAEISSVERLTVVADRLTNSWNELAQKLEWVEEPTPRETFDAIRDRASAMAANCREAPRWAAFLAAAATAGETLAASLVPLLLAGSLPTEQATEAFERAFWMEWLAAVIAERPVLRSFDSLSHERRIEEFRRLDEKVLVENRLALLGQRRKEAQIALQTDALRGAMQILRRELEKQRRHRPIRTTLREAEAAVRAIHPCYLMSPMTVAQFLDGSMPTFDLVIFDEASQLPTEDAAGAVLRGRQLVVVGDPKQLPPTNFFAATSGQIDVDRDEDGNPLYEDTESVLEEFLAGGAPRARLKWHYRSAEESLIAFSNVSFYDSELLTFPSVRRAGEGLQFEYVPDGLYEGKGLNRNEAERVVNAVVEHARQRPGESLGVGTFGLRQQYLILDLIEERRRHDDSLEPFFARDRAEPFFVKNLENIQGDERDVILLSITYGKEHDGRLRYRFGPINQENGWRRLNVLVTRARRSMTVFSSIRADDFHLETTNSAGAQLLRDFLAFAERRQLDSAIVRAGAETESPFEREVLVALKQRGLQLVPQVGACGYRIDFGVIDNEIPDRFVCGIECDGASYHLSETARDRDRLRQQVLEDRGWILHRIWSTDWFKDRHGQIERILRLVEDTRNRLRSVEIDPNHEERLSAHCDLADSTNPEDNGKRESLSVPGDERDFQVSPTARDQTNLAFDPELSVPYEVTTDSRFMGRDLLSAAERSVSVSVLQVVETEAPIHLQALIGRVAALWGTRAGSRIADRIRRSIQLLRSQREIFLRDDFVWTRRTRVRVRSRSDVINPPADQIPPEEYQEAVRMALRNKAPLSREQLVTAVRTLLGFQRTGAVLERHVSSAISELVQGTEIGEGSTGFTLRKPHT